VQTTEPVPQSAQMPGRTDVQGSNRMPPPVRASRLQRATPPIQRCGGCLHRTLRRQAPSQRSGQPERSAPLFGLTFRAMQRMRRHQALNSGHSAFGVVSVLALLAFACFPVWAQATDSSGVQYSDAPPTATGTNPPSSHETPAKTSVASGGGASAPSQSSTTTNSSGESLGGGGSSSATTGNAPIKGNDGGTGQGSPDKGGADAPSQSVQQAGHPGGSSASKGNDGASSPLVPILIAIAALAAISIGAVILRARQQRRSPGAAISPKAS